MVKRGFLELIPPNFEVIKHRVRINYRFYRGNKVANAFTEIKL